MLRDVDQPGSRSLWHLSRHWRPEQIRHELTGGQPVMIIRAVFVVKRSDETLLASYVLVCSSNGTVIVSVLL